MADDPELVLTETVEDHVRVVVDALLEARQRDRLRTALRQLSGWELRLVVCALLTDAAPEADYGPEHRSELLLTVDALCGLERRRE